MTRRPPATCGTRARYVAGCHCDLCVQASRDYHRAHRWPVGRRLPRLAQVMLAGLWVEQAACRGRDTELWFRDQHDGDYSAARQVCDGCPVRADCLDWAIQTHTVHGMFGGLSPHERRRLAGRRAS